MAFLFTILRTRLRHIRRIKKDMSAKIDPWLNKATTFNICVGMPGFFWFEFQDIKLMPKADKYLLVGEDTVMEKIKTQIYVENTRSKVLNMWYRKEHPDIEIMKENWQYQASTDDEKNICLLLCVSSETDQKTGNYWLPAKLPPNVKCMTFVETQFRTKELNKYVTSYLKEKQNKLWAVFKVYDFKLLSPVSSSMYMNTKIDASSRQILLVAYALSVSLMLKKFVPLRKF